MRSGSKLMKGKANMKGNLCKFTFKTNWLFSNCVFHLFCFHGQVKRSVSKYLPTQALHCLLRRRQSITPVNGRRWKDSCFLGDKEKWKQSKVNSEENKNRIMTCIHESPQDSFLSLIYPGTLWTSSMGWIPWLVMSTESPVTPQSSTEPFWFGGWPLTYYLIKSLPIHPLLIDFLVPLPRLHRLVRNQRKHYIHFIGVQKVILFKGTLKKAIWNWTI